MKEQPCLDRQPQVQPVNRDSDSKTHLVLLLGCLTVCVTRVWAGVDSLWEQKKLNARKCLQTAQNPQRPVHALLGGDLVPCYFFFSKATFCLDEITPDAALITITTHRCLSKSFQIKSSEVLGFPCLNININVPIYYLHTWKKNHE